MPSRRCSTWAGASTARAARCGLGGSRAGWGSEPVPARKFLQVGPYVVYEGTEAELLALAGRLGVALGPRSVGAGGHPGVYGAAGGGPPHPRGGVDRGAW